MSPQFKSSFLAIILAFLPTFTSATDLEYECFRVIVPFAPKTDMNGGALWVTNTNSPNAMSPLIVIVAFCGNSNESEAGKMRAREKFINDEKAIKTLCIDSLDQRTIQHRSNYTERRFACTQSGQGKPAYIAGSFVELNGDAMVIGYADDAPRKEAEVRFETILESLKSR